jgi:hypothetical protein
MLARRLDDRIRHICAQIAAAGRDPLSTDKEVEALLQELLAVIHKKVERLRLIATRKLLQAEGADNQDRRKSA